MPFELLAVLLESFVLLCAHGVNTVVGLRGELLQDLGGVVAIGVGTSFLKLRLDYLLPQLFEAHSTALLSAIGLTHTAEGILARRHVYRVVLILLDLAYGASLEHMPL